MSISVIPSLSNSLNEVKCIVPLPFGSKLGSTQKRQKTKQNRTEQKSSGDTETKETFPYWSFHISTPVPVRVKLLQNPCALVPSVMSLQREKAPIQVTTVSVSFLDSFSTYHPSTLNLLLSKPLITPNRQECVFSLRVRTLLYSNFHITSPPGRKFGVETVNSLHSEPVDSESKKLTFYVY